MIFGLTDAAFYTAVGTALAAIIPAILAYRRASRTENRTSDLDTLREIIKTLQYENTIKDKAMLALSKRVDNCESDKDNLQGKLFDLQLEVYKLKAAIKDA